MSNTVPEHSTIGDELVFADGVRIRLLPKAPGEERATPEELYKAVTGFGGEPVHPADIAALSGRKRDLGTFDLRSK